MKQFIRTAAVFLRALPHFVVFELMYKLLLLALGLPAANYMLTAAMKHTGVSYLSLSNMPKLLLNPLSVGLAVFTLFLIAFFSFVEVSALIVCFANVRQRKKCTSFGILSSGVRAFLKALHGKGIIVFLLFMLIVPAAQFTLSAGIFFAPIAPALRSYLGGYGTWAAAAVFISVESVIVFLLVSRCYSFHYLILTDTPFEQCTVKSRRCTKGRHIRIALSVIIWSIVMIIAAAAVTFVTSFLTVLAVKGFSKPETAFTTSLHALHYAAKVFYAVSAFFSAPMVVCSLTENFFGDSMQQDEHFISDFTEQKRYSAPVRFISAIAVTAMAVFLNFSQLRDIYRGNSMFSLSFINTPQVTAHRGYSRKAPENTMYAFQAAVDVGADYIELDIQQTADGQLVVFHDKDISRTTDGKGSLSSFTYDELQQFSNGSWFGKDGEFNDSRIMLLSDVLEQLSGEILMNIEIKKSAKDSEIARQTVELLNEYDMADSCYITSFSYSALKAVKKADPTVKTGLISHAATGAVYSKLRYIDALSLNYAFVNENLVSAAHQNGKRVFVWTVNNSEDMRRVLEMGVDNIITDRPDVAAEVIYSYSSSDAVLAALRRVFGTAQ